MSKPSWARRPTKEELESIGAVDNSKVLSPSADPECPKCKGTGEITTPSRCRGGHVCPCVFNKRTGAKR